MIKDYNEIVTDIIKYSVLGYNRFLTIADSGNVSCRYGDGLIITAGGVSLGEVTKDTVINVDMNGNVLSKQTNIKPSKETKMHISIYKQCSKVKCIYHVHPVHATVYAIQNKEIPLLTSTSKRKICSTAIVPYAEPGSELLANYVCETLKQTGNSIKILILENHGIICMAETLTECFQLAELLESTAKIALMMK